MDISKDPKFPKRHSYKTGSFISCPINNKKKVIGVLNISDKKDGTPFTEFEFELMTTIAYKVADVIENACLVLELKVKNEQLEQTQKMLMDMERLTHRLISNIFQISRNSLNSITGAAYFLENSSEQSLTDKQEFYKIIYKESQTITQLIDFLPISTRIENGNFFIPNTQVDLKKILFETVGSSILKKSLAKKNIRIELDAEQKVSDILGDKNSVKKFFKFLMEGLCYFFHDGIIDIHLREDKYLQIDVVVPAQISYNFSSEAESFTWGESIGDFFITYARKIAEAHQWCMSLENRSGQSVFRIQIPNHSISKSADFITRGTDVVLTLTAQILEPETCSLFLKDKLTSGLTLKGAFCHTKDFIQKPIKLSYEDRIVGWVSIEGKPLFQVPNLDPRSFICLPLMNSNKLIGVLTLNKKKNGEIYRNKDFLFSLFLGDILSEFAESLFDNFLTEEVFMTDVNLLENLTLHNSEPRSRHSVIPAKAHSRQLRYRPGLKFVILRRPTS
jgi:putative methionine-R-sulfoxide reductase with GAF domain